MREQKVIIMKGLQGSGKSTRARDLQAAEPGRYKRISKDDLRAMLDGGAYSYENEEFVRAARDGLINAALSRGYSVIVDDTNLHPLHERQIRGLVEVWGIAVEVVSLLDVPLETCIARDAQRAHPVGEAVIRNTWARYLAPPAPEQGSE